MKKVTQGLGEMMMFLLLKTRLLSTQLIRNRKANQSCMIFKPSKMQTPKIYSWSGRVMETMQVQLKTQVVSSISIKATLLNIILLTLHKMLKTRMDLNLLRNSQPKQYTSHSRQILQTLPKMITQPIKILIKFLKTCQQI